MGADGHYASLFPGTTALAYTGHRQVLENYVPSMDSWRITLTPPCLRRCRHRYLLTGGPDKLAVLQAPEQYPVGQLLPPNSSDHWFLYRDSGIA
jgi:6-phosphogluconolactonase